VVRAYVHLSGAGIDSVDRLFDNHLALVAFVVSKAAVARIGEPDSSVRMYDYVVWCVERLAHPLVGQNRVAAIALVTNDSPFTVLARKLTPFPVKGVAIAVIRRVAKHADMTVVC